MLLTLLEQIDRIQDAILLFFTHQFFLAPVLLLSLDEAGLPLPLGDFTIAYTGYQVSLGRVSYLFAIAILLVADLAGASFLYFISEHYGTLLIKKLEKYIDLDENKLKNVEDKFRKHGVIFIIIGRHLPGFRIPITIFSGISEITYKTFILSTLVSILPWIIFFLSFGQRLGPRTLNLIHEHHSFLILALLPILVSIAPLFWLRKPKKKIQPSLFERIFKRH